MNRLLLGSFLAALALFVWGFLFWGLPWPNPAFEHLDPTAETAVWQALRDHVPEPGTYYLPGVLRAEGGDEAEARHESGPLAMLFVHPEGAPLMNPSVLVMGFLHMLATCLLMALLLRMAAPVLDTFGRRVAFVVLAGLVGAVWANFGEPIWWYHPWAYHLATLVSDGVSWGLAGLVLAKFVQPVRAQAMA